MSANDPIGAKVLMFFFYSARLAIANRHFKKRSNVVQNRLEAIWISHDFLKQKKNPQLQCQIRCFKRGKGKLVLRFKSAIFRQFFSLKFLLESAIFRHFRQQQSKIFRHFSLREQNAIFAAFLSAKKSAIFREKNREKQARPKKGASRD
jgi:hypothetical protein